MLRFAQHDNLQPARRSGFFSVSEPDLVGTDSDFLSVGLLHKRSPRSTRESFDRGYLLPTEAVAEAKRQ